MKYSEVRNKIYGTWCHFIRNPVVLDFLRVCYIVTPDDGPI